MSIWQPFYIGCIEIIVRVIFNFATDGKSYRYGSIGAPVTLWGPWYAGIAHEEGDFLKVQNSFASMLRHEVILDLFRYFTLFSTDKHNRKIKIVCRYQQYEGANLIVNRVKVGYPKKGLIWHFQGSGKSLLMVFAAQKLRMMKELNAPTVIIVNDRLDLCRERVPIDRCSNQDEISIQDRFHNLVELMAVDAGTFP